MPPKPPKAPGGKNRQSEEEKQQVLQAVVIADTFETKFSPFTLERPRCLLPVLNTPLIEYTLEWLASVGVDEVYLYAGSHVDQVEAYINASAWKRDDSPFQKFVFLRTVAASVGDVLRDLDQKDVMVGDFLCVSGDVVANVPIDKALRKHRKRRETDKNAIMTMILSESASAHQPTQNAIVPTFVIDITKNKCLHYQEVLAGQGIDLSIDPERLATPQIDIRQDLMDCRIDICTPAVLNLWSDNFDNQSLRKDFLHGLLRDELNDKTIHTYITQHHYASRISDLFNYDQASVEILRRWALPFSVENIIFVDKAYENRGKGIYHEPDVVLAKSCRLEPNTIIGEGSTVSVGAVIRNSVIGRRCHIGKNSVVDGAYIWDDVVVGDNVKITRAVIANNASIGDRSRVAECALISYGVRVDEGAAISSNARLTNIQENGHDGYAEEQVSKQPSIIYRQPAHAVSTDTLDSQSSTEDDPLEVMSGRSSRTHSVSDAGSDGGAFHREAANTMTERMQTDKEPEDVRLELVSSRLAHNATPHMVRKAVAVALMKHIQMDIENGKATPAEASKAALERYNLLIARDYVDEAVEDQVDFLLEAQKDLVSRRDGGRILFFVTKDLYDLEIFTEDAFLQWWQDDRSKGTPQMEQLRSSAAQFIQWLQDAESESESDNDD